MRRTVRVLPSQRSVRRRAWAVVLAGVCGIVAFAIYGQVAQSSALSSEAAALQQENSALQRQIAEQQQQVVEAQTVSWLQEEARKLGYVVPGEKTYVISGAPAASSGGVLAPLPAYAPPTPVPTPTPKPTPPPSPTPVHLGGGSPAATPSPAA